MGDVILPWPTRNASPNGRVHWRTRYAEQQKQKNWAYAATLAAGLTLAHDGPGGEMRPDNVTVVITAYPKTKRRPDMDNVIASLKGALDGFALGLGVDDKCFNLRFQWGEPVRGGRVTFSILEGAQ